MYVSSYRFGKGIEGMDLKKNYNNVVAEAKIKLIYQSNMFFIHIFILPSIDTRAYLNHGFCKY